jgi:hypothetical protein
VAATIPAVGLGAPPLAHASSGAPLWAIAIAIVVVLVALYLVLGPAIGRRSQGAESLAELTTPSVPSPGAGADAGEGI